jgi:hypothetical protein
MIFILILSINILKRESIKKKETSAPTCGTPPTKNKYGCSVAYGAVLTEIAKDERIKIGRRQNKTIIKEINKITRKAIDPALLLAAAEEFLSKCVATACNVDPDDANTGCKILFDTPLTVTEIETIVGDFETLCDITGTEEEAAPTAIPTLPAGGDDILSSEDEALNETGQTNEIPGGGNKANQGMYVTKANAILLLIALAIGKLFF